MNSVKLLGIIGDPIDHSLSPLMQNAALKQKKLPSLYLPFQVASSELSRFIRRARRGNFSGFNVTIPHKETILPYLDSISPEARQIGAVNTVVVRGGRLKGFNTDAAGFLRSLTRETRFKPRGKRMMVLGAGGAARAVLWILARSGAEKIYLCNRTPSRAGRIVKAFQRAFPKVSIEKIPLKKGLLSELFPALDLLVNATSVGLNGTRFKGLPLSRLSKKAIVSDLVPAATPLLRDARRLGLRTHAGEGMLVEQGALSFELWTGKKADRQMMREVLCEKMDLL